MPRITISPVVSGGKSAPAVSMIAICGPAASPTLPGIRLPFSGLLAIWCAASVMP
jgi:hypothetical protein